MFKFQNPPVNPIISGGLEYSLRPDWNMHDCDYMYVIIVISVWMIVLFARQLDMFVPLIQRFIVRGLGKTTCVSIG